MNALALTVARLRLTADLWLHRHGPWGWLLAIVGGVLLCLAAIVIPRLAADLADRQALLLELQTRAASPQEAPAAPVSASEVHYTTFRETLADASQVLPTIKTVLDAAASHHLRSTRAEYLRGHDEQAQAETLQMILPVRGRYTDIRRWLEEILSTQEALAVNELGFKREDIGVDQIEAKVRLTLWHRPARPPSGAGASDHDERQP